MGCFIYLAVRCARDWDFLNFRAICWQSLPRTAYFWGVEARVLHLHRRVSNYCWALVDLLRSSLGHRAYIVGNHNLILLCICYGCWVRIIIRSLPLQVHPGWITLMARMFLCQLWHIGWVWICWGLAIAIRVVRVDKEAIRSRCLHLCIPLTVSQLSWLCLLVGLNIINDSFGGLQVLRTGHYLLLSYLLLCASIWQLAVLHFALRGRH